MLYKQKGSRNWSCRFQVGGKEVRRSTGTTDRQAALEYEAKIKAELWRQHRLGERPTYLWDQAAAAWLEQARKRSLSKDRQIIRRLTEDLRGVPLTDIRGKVIEGVRIAIAQDTSEANANRYMALLRSILNAAVEWEMLESAPKVPMYRLESAEPRWITREQFGTLVSHLPEHLAVIARFAVYTGLRQRNVSYLRWQQVDTERRCAWILGAQAKAKKPIPVPLNTEALKVLEEQRGKHEEWVFPYQGHPQHQVSTKAWRAAVRKAGIAPFRFHDLRHTWASWHIQAGTPAFILQEMGGWSSPEMVKRYAHLNPGHLSDYADRIVSGIEAKSDDEKG